MKKFKRFFFPFIKSTCLLSIVAGPAAAGPLEKKEVIYSTHPESIRELVADEFEKSHNRVRSQHLT